MARQKVIILGATGMLGSMLLDTFASDSRYKVIATYRDRNILKLLRNKYPGVDFRRLDVEHIGPKGILGAIKGSSWIVNAIGITKPYIHDGNAEDVRRAIYVNAYFPHLLAEAARITGSKIIHIATDCVYSGQKGRYTELDPHGPLDVYGKTKSLGEVFGDKIYHLRCSVVGPELKGHFSLFDWFLRQPEGARVDGFTNHLWNGITILHFARICVGIVEKGASLPHVQHIVPGSSVSKADLLRSLAKEYNREDIKIRSVMAPTAINRTLSTVNKKLNRKLWRLAGYKAPPTIAKMIGELAQKK